MKTVGLVHTSATLVPVFKELVSKNLNGISTFNIVDDSLIADVIKKGILTPKTAKRVVDHVLSAEEAGADYILVTCSSIGRAVETAAKLCGVPVLRVDQPMADLAIQSGSRIGVIATLPTTLEPTSDLVERRALLAGKKVSLTSHLCDGAFEALMSGDADLHDDLVRKGIQKLNKEVDVILLAQASMARVVETLASSDRQIPILASPSTAIKHLSSIL